MIMLYLIETENKDLCPRLVVDNPQGYLGSEIMLLAFELSKEKTHLENLIRGISRDITENELHKLITDVYRDRYQPEGVTLVDLSEVWND